VYSEGDLFRLLDIDEKPGLPIEQYRTSYRRDYSRIIHSPAFRRLQGKTQLFPGQESDFFRNRLTHSIEVSQIAYDLAIKLNNTSKILKDENLQINPEICQIAGLIHDFGHPPFGHNGEKALDDCMKKHGGFEGNAQTLRILMRLEKKEYEDGTFPHGFTRDGDDKRVGLNLTARSILSALKYDNVIPREREDDAELVKGYYHTEAKDIEILKDKVLPGHVQYKDKGFKTIECQIMDIADDIAYSTYDLEDSFKAGFITPYDILMVSDKIVSNVYEKLKKEYEKTTIKSSLTNLFGSVFAPIIENQRGIKKDKDYIGRTLEQYINAYEVNSNLTRNGYLRAGFTSYLVSYFMSGIDIIKEPDLPASLYKVKLSDDKKLSVDVLKHLTYQMIIDSPMLKVVEYRGYGLVKSIFNSLISDKGWRLLPEDFQEIYHIAQSDEKKRVVCDFIAGMTDRYALEFYDRLSSSTNSTIFKPL